MACSRSYKGTTSMPEKGKVHALRGNMEIRTADPILRKLFTIANARGLNHVEIGRRIDRTPETVSNWKRGKGTPSILDANILAQALGCSLLLQETT